MDKKELLELIETGEGYTLEFKESLSSSIGKDICAFTNSSGGKIILGVKDNGIIKGYNLSNRDKSKIQDIAKNMEPSLNVKIEQIDNLVIVFVSEGKDKPYFVNGHCYIRQGASSVLLNREELRDFFQREDLIIFDKKANNDFKFEEDFNENTFELFIERAKISKDLGREHILKNLNLITNGKLNNAGVLFFCRNLKKFFLNGGVAAVLYRTPDKADVMDIKEFYDDFVSNYENVMKYILIFLSKNIEIKGIKREENLEIPEEALRESLINAMVHRDYFIQGRVQVDIYPDRLEISNPGRLLFDEKELGNVSVARNPILFDLVHRLGYIEKVGSGIKRIKRLVPDVKFEITSDWFRVVFKRKTKFPEKFPEKTEEILRLLREKLKTPRERLLNMLSKKVGSKLVEKVGSKLVESQIKILLIVFEKPNITKREMSKILRISETAIDKNIAKLKSLGILKRVGPDKGGYWKVLK